MFRLHFLSFPNPLTQVPLHLLKHIVFSFGEISKAHSLDLPNRTHISSDLFCREARTRAQACWAVAPPLSTAQEEISSFIGLLSPVQNCFNYSIQIKKCN
jgi:hypothetical protein